MFASVDSWKHSGILCSAGSRPLWFDDHRCVGGLAFGVSAYFLFSVPFWHSLFVCMYVCKYEYMQIDKKANDGCKFGANNLL